MTFPALSEQECWNQGQRSQNERNREQFRNPEQPHFRVSGFDKNDAASQHEQFNEIEQKPIT